jgi:hypothetical protein
MKNEELYESLISEFGFNKIVSFCQMISFMNDHLHQSLSTEPISEFSEDRDWWMEKYNKLTKKIE